MRQQAQPRRDERASAAAPTQPLPAVNPVAPARKYPTLASMATIVARAQREEEAEATRRAEAERAEREALQALAHDVAAPADSGAGGRPRQGDSSPRHDRGAASSAGAQPRADGGVPPRPADDRRPLPLPSLDVVIVVAGIQAALAAVAALVSAVLLIHGDALAAWTLILTALLICGGWLAYALAQNEEWRAAAGGALVASQVAILGWALALVGPRAALLMLVPAFTLLALRTAGQLAAVICVAGALGLYAVFDVLALAYGLLPALTLDASALAVVDGIFVVAGLLLTLAGAFEATSGRARAELLAQSRQSEVRALRARLAQIRRRQEENAALLYSAADAAMQGDPQFPDGVDGVYSPVVERLTAVGELVAELREDRRERRAQESALRQLVHTLERAWLGLPWSWPEPSGTLVDDVVALLRTPSPRGQPPHTEDEQPSGFIPVPTDPELRARRRVIPSPTSRPRNQVIGGAGLHDEVAHPRTSPEPAPAQRHTSPLRWREWDDWRDWQLDG